MGININQQNGMFLGGGILAYMLSGKLGPLKGIAKLGGLAAAALGAADVVGIFKINDVMSKIPIVGSNFAGWEREQYGAYAVDLRQLPYDPNNYYYPR
jgi:hypothetical protein